MSDTPPLAKVSGVVKLDGQPLSHGSVQFTPDQDKGTTGRMAIGEIGPDGRFELSTIKPHDGAQIGFHKVSVQSFQPLDEKAMLSGGPAPLISLVPANYRDPLTSGLTAEVTKGQNEVVLELQSPPAKK